MYIYTPTEDPVFESLKTITVDDSCLGPLIATSCTGIKAPHYGCRASEEQKKRMSDAQKNSTKHSTRGKKRPEFSKRMAGKNNPMHGTISPNRGVKVPITTCPHCNKVGGVHQLKQWHFDNCKFK